MTISRRIVNRVLQRRLAGAKERFQTASGVASAPRVLGALTRPRSPEVENRIRIAPCHCRNKEGEERSEEQARMSSIRIISNSTHSPYRPCARCSATGCHWDCLAGQPICPDCQESLLRGESDALVLRREQSNCCVCVQGGTVPYLTYPLHETQALEIDLCPEHLRDMMARRLSVRAFRRLRRQMNLLGVAVEQIFLLHESFYDESGTALRPLSEMS